MDVLSDVVATMRTGRPHASRSRRSAPWGTRFDRFAGAGFHVVLRGSCWLVPEHGAATPLGPGDVVALLPDAPPHGLADAPATPLTGRPAQPGGAAATVLLCGAYLPDRSRPHPLLAELPGMIHLPAAAGRNPALRTAVDLLGAELEQPGPGTGAVVSTLLELLLLYVVRAWYAERAGQATGSGWAAALADPAISTALHRLHQAPDHLWTVAALAGQAGLSRAAFARRFTALVGQPPLGYLTWWRMTVAARLLRDSDIPLHAVAARTGYSSEFAFAKAFKREYGVAPGGYRRGGQPH